MNRLKSTGVKGLLEFEMREPKHLEDSGGRG